MPSNALAFQATGSNRQALFTLKLHRGDGMLLLAMNWRTGKPPANFVGFTIEYKEPGGEKYFALKNRISFIDNKGKVNAGFTSSRNAPFQKFRWVHFPQNAELPGAFTYRVMPAFMNERGELSYGEFQEASLHLKRETFPGKMNITYTRGFISSQAFVDKFGGEDGVKSILPKKGSEGLDFVPTHIKSDEALSWMGFEARSAIFELLDKAVADKKAQVKVVAYDLNEPHILQKLLALKKRLKIIIDDSGEHGHLDSPESIAATKLAASSGGRVKRQHMGQLQHNKTIVVESPTLKAVICGSTNFTWRGLYVQSNNAVVLYGAKAIKPFLAAFDQYWASDSSAEFASSSSALWKDLSNAQMDMQVSFSPHNKNNALLDEIADDLRNQARSSVFYSLAFLSQTQGSIRKAISEITNEGNLFIYGISDKKTGGFDLQKPEGTVVPVYPAELKKNLPEPFKSEPTGGFGTRMHHKFIVIDFDKPTARVYFGSYNFSPTADLKNGENLILIKNQKAAVSFMIEAIRIFDHYHFRVARKEAAASKKILALKKPPTKPGETAWWEEYYTNPRKIRDRIMFSR